MERLPLALAIIGVVVAAALIGGALFLGQGPQQQRTVARSFEDCAAAGFPIMESYPPRCSDGVNTFTEESCALNGTFDMLTISDAVKIAEASECGNNIVAKCDCPSGFVRDGDVCNPSCYYSTPRCLAPSVACGKSYFCNGNTGTYWLGMNISREGCSPACVVNVTSRQAEINWRCTGLLT